MSKKQTRVKIKPLRTRVVSSTSTTSYPLRSTTTDTTTTDTTSTSTTHRFHALDPNSYHPLSNQVGPVAKNVEDTLQLSQERIIVKDSAGVQISTTDIKAAIALQVAIQVAIGVVINIAVLGNAGGNSQEAERIAAELIQKSNIRQVSNQLTLVENSRDVTVTTTDTDIAVNIQVLIQVLVAIAINVGVLGNAGA